MPDIGPRQFEDWSLRIRDSDRDACAEIFRVMHPALLRYAIRLTGREQTAEDIVQEAFIRLWRRRQRLDPSESLRGLLYATVRNLAFNEQRDTKRRQNLLTEMDQPDRSPVPDATTGARMLQERMRAWINEMPPRRREAFQLSRFDGLSYSEIAAVMQLSVRTVERHIRLALAHLRKRLRAYDPTLLQS